MRVKSLYGLNLVCHSHRWVYFPEEGQRLGSHRDGNGIQEFRLETPGCVNSDKGVIEVRVIVTPLEPVEMMYDLHA